MEKAALKASQHESPCTLGSERPFRNPCRIPCEGVVFLLRAYRYKLIFVLVRRQLGRIV